MPETRSALVIDDSPVVRSVLSALLRHQGLSVVAVRDGEAGLAHAADHPPSVVCLDLMLPNTSGLDVCRALRAMPSTADVPIVVVSARPYPQDRAAAIEAGADAFVQKPVDPVVIDGHVRRLMWARRAGRRAS